MTPTAKLDLVVSDIGTHPSAPSCSNSSSHRRLNLTLINKATERRSNSPPTFEYQRLAGVERENYAPQDAVMAFNIQDSENSPVDEYLLTLLRSLRASAVALTPKTKGSPGEFGQRSRRIQRASEQRVAGQSPLRKLVSVDLNDD